MPDRSKNIYLKKKRKRRRKRFSPPDISRSPNKRPWAWRQMRRRGSLSAAGRATSSDQSPLQRSISKKCWPSCKGSLPKLQKKCWPSCQCWWNDKLKRYKKEIVDKTENFFLDQFFPSDLDLRLFLFDHLNIWPRLLLTKIHKLKWLFLRGTVWCKLKLDQLYCARLIKWIIKRSSWLNCAL